MLPMACLPSPLKAIRILDLTRLLPGGFCTLILADLGADVIKVEEPRVGDYIRELHPYLHLMLNRNKRSIAINLKDDGGREILYRLVLTSDVLIEGFRPGVTRRLKVDYDTLSAINPRLIFCSITGYGQDGPYSQAPGHDVNYVGVAGLLAAGSDKPVIPKVQIADLSAGAMAAIAVLAALRQREVTERGTYIDISMAETSVFWNILNLATLFWRKELVQEDFVLTGRYACYNVYEARDGKYLTLGALERKFRRPYAKALEGTIL